MGSMLELGDTSDEAHAALGRRLCSCRADMVFLFGEEIRPAMLPLEGRPFFHTCDRDELSGKLDAYVKDGDLVLLKASRGCELETLSEMLLGVKHVS
jgi:UDP-N-acetylmuramoyl-tripeptide--D-alanyl-D-alanine ligase